MSQAAGQPAGQPTIRKAARIGLALTSETRPYVRESRPCPKQSSRTSGLTPVTQGWFVVNVRDAEWWFSERRGARCAFESEYGDPPVEFDQLGINVTVLEPGQTGLYHAEANQQAFLVLSGEYALLVEGESDACALGTSSTLPRGPSTPSSVRARGRA